MLLQVKHQQDQNWNHCYRQLHRTWSSQSIQISRRHISSSYLITSLTEPSRLSPQEAVEAHTSWSLELTCRWTSQLIVTIPCSPSSSKRLIWRHNSLCSSTTLWFSHLNLLWRMISYKTWRLHLKVCYAAFDLIILNWSNYSLEYIL